MDKAIEIVNQHINELSEGIDDLAEMRSMSIEAGETPAAWIAKEIDMLWVARDELRSVMDEMILSTVQTTF